jgi:hypothetical protein
MAGPLGVLPVGPTASTTEFEDDVNGRALGGTAGGSDSVRHQAWNTTSMAGPLGGTVDGSGNVHHRV